MITIFGRLQVHSTGGQGQKTCRTLPTNIQFGSKDLQGPSGLSTANTFLPETPRSP